MQISENDTLREPCLLSKGPKSGLLLILWFQEGRDIHGCEILLAFFKGCGNVCILCEGYENIKNVWDFLLNYDTLSIHQ